MRKVPFALALMAVLLAIAHAQTPTPAVSCGSFSNNCSSCLGAACHFCQGTGFSFCGRNSCSGSGITEVTNCSAPVPSAAQCNSQANSCADCLTGAPATCGWCIGASATFGFCNTNQTCDGIPGTTWYRDCGQVPQPLCAAQSSCAGCVVTNTTTVSTTRCVWCERTSTAGCSAPTSCTGTAVDTCAQANPCLTLTSCGACDAVSECEWCESDTARSCQTTQDGCPGSQSTTLCTEINPCWGLSTCDTCRANSNCSYCENYAGTASQCQPQCGGGFNVEVNSCSASVPSPKAVPTPTQASPTQASSTQGSPTQGNPTQGTPTQGSPTQGTPTPTDQQGSPTAPATPATPGTSPTGTLPVSDITPGTIAHSPVASPVTDPTPTTTGAVQLGSSVALLLFATATLLF